MIVLLIKLFCFTLVLLAAALWFHYDNRTPL